MTRLISFLALTMTLGINYLSAQPTFTITPQSITPNVGDTVNLDVQVTGFTSVLSFQYSMDWDPAIMQFVSLGNYNLSGLGASNFGTTQTNQGKIAVSWSDPNAVGVTLAGTPKIYRIKLKVLNNQAPWLIFNSNPTPIEVILGNGNDVSQTTVFQNLGMPPANGSPIIVAIGSDTVPNGQQVCLPVSVQNFNDILSTQYSINWNPAVLQYQSVTGLNLAGLTQNSFGTTTTANGQLALSWSDPNATGLTIPSGTNIFNVCFNVVGSNGQSSSVSITSTPTPVEVVQNTPGGDQNINLTPSNGTVLVGTSGGGGGGGGTWGTPPTCPANIFTIGIADTSIAVGSSFCVPVVVNNFTNIVSIQHSIHWDKTKLKLTSVGGFNLSGLTLANYGLQDTANGTITFAWLDPNVTGITLPAGSTIYQLCFTALGAGATFSNITFDGTPTIIEVTNSNGNTVQTCFETGSICFGNCGSVTPPDTDGNCPANVFAILADSLSSSPGTLVCVPFRVQNFTNIHSVQYSMHWDKTKIKLKSVNTFQPTPVLAGLSATNFNFADTINGNLTLSWTGTTPANVTLANGTDIYELCFQVVGTAGSFSNINFDGSPTAIAVSNASGAISNANLCFDPGTVTITAPVTNTSCPLNVFAILGDSVSTAPGTMICVPVRVQNFTNILSMQYSMHWDKTKIKLKSVNTFQPSPILGGLNASNFGFQDTLNGNLTFAWTDPNVTGVTLTNGADIYELCFQVVGANGTFSNINFDGSPTIIEISNTSGPISNSGVCFDPGTVTIINNVVTCAPFSLSAVVTPLTCNGNFSGAINLTVTGTPGINYTYNWKGPALFTATTEDISGLKAGTYYATVSCGSITHFDTLVVTQPPVFIISTITNSIKCNSGTGSITVTVTGGTQPYSFLWNNNAMTQNIAGVPAGSYFFYLTDANQCKDTSQTITLTQPNPLIVTAADVDIPCFGLQVGAIDLMPSGGTPPYTYAWTGSNAGLQPGSQDQANIGIGNAIVVVTDANLCKDTLGPIAITQPAAPVSASETHVNPTAPNNGSIDITPSGGTGNYTYHWTGSGVQTSAQDQTGLAGGTYTYLVTDSNGCSTSGSVTLVLLIPIVVDSAQITGAGCPGDDIGAIHTFLHGGTPPLIYEWRNNANPTVIIGAQKDITGLAGGSYTLRIIDANGQVVNFNYVVGQSVTPITLNATIDPQDGPTGAGLNGAIDLSPTGGTGIGTFHFVWSDLPSTVSVEDRVPIGPGQFSVTITDANGCLETASYEVPYNPSLLIANVLNSSNVKCNGGADGSVNIKAQGGDAIYSVSLNSNVISTDYQGNFSISGLAAGTYPLIVSDTNGQQVQLIVVITEPTAVNVTSIVNNANCACNGLVDLTVSGGTPPYAYVWNTGQISQDLFNICANTSHSATVTDANGCIFDFPAVTIQDASSIMTLVSATVNDVECPGETNGSVEVVVQGGAPPYAYTWKDQSGNIINLTSQLQGVGTGFYYVTITDQCSPQHVLQLSFQVKSTSTLDLVNVSVTNTSGVGVSDGTATAIATGGLTPYTYQWCGGTPQGDGSTVTGLSSGACSVTVTDAVGCIDVLQFNVSVGAGILVTQVKGVKCYGECNGRASVQSVPNSLPPLSYHWENGENTQTAVQLCGGLNKVTITDGVGNQYTAEVTISEPDSLTVLVLTTPASGVNFEDGTATAIADGGTPPYTYKWNDATASTNAAISSLAPNTYFVLVTDDSGCKTLASGIVGGAPKECLNGNNVITPNQDGKNDIFDILPEGCAANYNYIKVQIFNRWGQLVYATGNYLNDWGGTDESGALLPEGGYFYIVEAELLNGKVEEKRGSLTILRE